MTTIGFIGLGTMGLPMATSLVKAGHAVVGYNRSRSRADELAAAGGRAANSVREAVEAADVVVTMLPDTPDVRSTVLGDDGILATAAPGTLLIDCSTILPEAARTMAEAAFSAGHRMVDAPVSGGQAGAVEGALSIMVGGDPADFDAARPVLEAVGTTVVHVGPAGAGQIVKAANQLMVAGNIQLLAEALVLVEAHGVDVDAAVRVIGGGLAGSTVLQRKAAGMIARDYRPGFRLELHHKDMGIAQQTARDVGVVTPLGAVAAQLVAAQVARGRGGLDHSALLDLVEFLSGRVEPSELPSA